MIHKNKLKEWGFLHTHTFALDGITSIPVCAALAETRAVNSVYLWLSQLSSDELEIMYVGKAGKGIKKRLKEHQNGFKRSPTGMKSANLIRQLLAQKKRYLYILENAQKYSSLISRSMLIQQKKMH
jgi:hypothetical protein